MIEFPNELVQEIVLQLDTGRDVKNFRLVSKAINPIAERVLWTTRPAVIRLNRDSTDAGMTILDECKRGCSAASLIRKLHIVSLSPEWSPKCTWDTSAEPEDTDVVKNASDRLTDVLPDALRALKGLVSVQWAGNSTEKCWIYNAVMEALASLPLLAIFELDRGFRTPFPPFHKLRHGNLRQFSMKTVRSDVESQRHFKYSLSELLHHNPNIAELDLGGISSVTLLHLSSLFDEVPGNSICLQTLTLGEVSIEPTPKMMSHLRSLHTLHLKSSQHISHSELWKALGLAGIALRCLTVHVTTDSLLDYLESFSGLHELSLFRPDEGDSLILAQRFYEDVLPKHSSTLRNLSVRPRYDGLWGIGVSNMSALDCCQKLENLELSLRSGDIQPEKKEADVVMRLIVHLSSFPCLDTLSLCPSIPNSWRGARCGTGPLSSQDHHARRIKQAILNFRRRKSPSSLARRKLVITVKDMYPKFVTVMN